MSETVSGAAAAPAAALTTTKESLIENIKTKVLADLTELETAAGVDLSKAKAELEAIGTEAESFFAKIEAWFKKHL